MPVIVRTGAGRKLTGDAAASHVLTGKTFYTTNQNVKLTGTMADRAGTSQAATGGTSGGSYRLTVPAAGYYGTDSYLTRAFSGVAGDIGLSAAKLMPGESVLGITGTGAMKTASGTVSIYAPYTTATVNGLAFTPVGFVFQETMSSSNTTGSEKMRIVFACKVGSNTYVAYRYYSAANVNNILLGGTSAITWNASSVSIDVTQFALGGVDVWFHTQIGYHIWGL